ncbi:GNAT family N-acetyltransferase [Gemmata sp. SH-PL17]|uniref:GNAT family N-acetyltransferase n=1 Tax=Gemmata sp. SH-PL17 TaxID=1630693 RepID=UPI0009EE14DB
MPSVAASRPRGSTPRGIKITSNRFYKDSETIRCVGPGGYSDPPLGKEFVGFGILQIEEHYSNYTGGLPHCYIPLLSVKPGIKSMGYGKSIVDHLIAEAALNVRDFEGYVSSYLFLDVYVANEPAIRLYRDKCQFVVLNPNNPISDPDEHNEPYFVMARNVALSEKVVPAPMPS